MFYELTPFTWGGAAWGIRPISQHLRFVAAHSSSSRQFRSAVHDCLRRWQLSAIRMRRVYRSVLPVARALCIALAFSCRMVPDFASFRGFLVLGGNQVSSIFDNNWVTGQSQSGLWFGKTDDLWSFGGCAHSALYAWCGSSSRQRVLGCLSALKFFLHQHERYHPHR